MNRVVLVLLGLIGLLGGALSATGETLFEIRDVRERELETIGFELTKNADLTIEAVGARSPYSDDLATCAWIINAETREPVWEMTEGDTDRHHRNKALRTLEENISLEKGKYELYVYAGSFWGGNITIVGGRGFLEFLGDIFSDDDDWDDEDWDDRDLDEVLEECYVRVSSSDIAPSDVREFDVTGDLPGALVRFSRLRDSEYIRQGFRLDKPMNIRIYAISEHPRGRKEPVDGGWIVNADNHQRVWEMDRWNTDRAGGGGKNRLYNDEIELDKGNYTLYFVTDDSHSAEEFNAAPPYDPLNWGITLLPGSGADASAFHLVDAHDPGVPLIDFTRARDDEYLEQAFELKKKGTLYIYALGEYSHSGREFCDGGWISDAATGRRVWEMTHRNTDYAGGADKNRMFDGTVELEAGRYIAHYVTDGSHSYRDWNSARPWDHTAWGMTVYAGKDLKESDFVLLEDSDLTKGSNVLVRIVRMRDNDHERETFSLDKETEVHIYAIGEYSSGNREFCDYGWIEEAKTGRPVWEMTRRNTRHAGGARKNRVYDDTILLDAGKYNVYYVTDGSHSFNDWNEDRPDDPVNWGITVSIAD